jgi:hypothetical protein
MATSLNQIGIERAEKILAAVKADLASYEAAAPSNYRDEQISQLRKQLVKREAILSDLKKGK